ncbi:hypothetical protein A9Q99_06485 [Gammaproteobacteria bacterium 45_16_T64]|nr:hypothetical protein A9Q99_06485 [Gammaproteobacteria bacterium 45_16_T64]
MRQLFFDRFCHFAIVTRGINTALLLLSLLVLGGCGADPAIELSADPAVIDEGDSSSLSWNVTYKEGATDIVVSIEPSIGIVDITGTVDVTPSVTTEYVLTTTAIINEEQSSRSKALTIEVIEGPSAPTVTDIRITRDSDRAGEPVVLTADVFDAESISFNGSTEGLTGGLFEVIVNPMQSTTYTLIATNQYGSTEKQVTVDVVFTEINASYISPYELRECVEAIIAEQGLTSSELVKEINCSRIDAFGVVEGLEQFNNLQVLDLSDNQVSGFSGWAGPLSNMRLEQLYLGNNNIESLLGIEYLPNLLNLDLSNNPLDRPEDIASIISNSYSLMHLNLQGIPMTGISLDFLPETLESLNLENTGLRSTEFLSSLQSLKELYLGSNAITNLVGSLLPIELEILDINDNFFSDLEGVNHLGGLVSLNVSNNPYIPVEQLTALLNQNENLLDLNVSHLPLQSLSALGLFFSNNPDESPGSFQLRTLKVDSTLISDFSMLVQHPSLEVLSLNDNSNVHFPDFSQLTNLAELSVANTGLGNMDMITPFLPNLTLLNVANNNVGENLDYCQFAELKTLNMDNVGLSDSSPFANYGCNSTLEVLSMADNDLEPFELTQLFESNQKLRELNLSGNQVVWLHWSEYQQTVEVLRLSNADLENISVRGFPKLRVLDLSDNVLLSDSSIDGALDLQLQELDISNTLLTSNSWSLYSLRRLDVSGAKVDFYNVAHKLYDMTKLEALAISGVDEYGYAGDISLLLNNVRYPERVTELHFDEGKVDSASDLRRFVNLRDLRLSNVDIISDSLYLDVQDSISVLDVSNVGLRQLSLPPFISSLHLAGNSSVEVLGLGGLQYLEVLDLSSVRSLEIFEIGEVVRNNYALRSLNLSGLAIEFAETVFEDVGANFALEYINLSDNHLFDLTLLSSLQHVKAINVNGNPIDDFAFIDTFHGLRELNVGNTISTNLPELIRFPELQRLNVENLQVDDPSSLINEIGQLEYLTALNVSGINIGSYDLSGWDVLALTELNLSNTNINDFYLPGIQSIRSLDLSGNPLEGIYLHFDNLEALYLNEIDDLESLGGNSFFYNLKILEVNHSAVSKFYINDVIRNSPHLHTLKIAGARDSDGEILLFSDLSWELGERVENIISLDVSGFYIDSSSDLNQYKSLREFVARNAVISDIQSLPTSIELIDLSNAYLQTELNFATLLSDKLSLSTLNLAGLDLRNVDLVGILGSWPIDLETLDVSDTGIDDSIFDYTEIFKGLISLKIAGNDWPAIPSGLLGDSLQVLDVSRNRISDVSGLPMSLRDVNLGDNPVSAFSMFSSHIRELSIGGTQIDDVSFLMDYHNLTKLDISRLSILDSDGLLNILAQLSQLEALNLSGVRLINEHSSYFEFDVPLANLKDINLSDTGVTEFDSRLYPNLETLDLSDNGLFYVTLSGPTLRYIDVSDTAISNMPLPNGQLKYLNVSRTQLHIDTVVSSIRSMNNLEGLGIGGLKRDDSSWVDELSNFLSEHSQIKYLDISDMGLFDIEFIDDLRSLEYLDVSNNFLRNSYHSSYPQQSNLVFLDFSGNVQLPWQYIESYLALNPRLERVGLNDINLENVDLFSILDFVVWSDIKELKLSRSGLSNWNTLNEDKYRKLETIEISGNELFDVPSWMLSESLRSVDISHNNIREVDFLSQYEGVNFERLDVGYNPLDGNLSLIPNLASLASIRELGVAAIVGNIGVLEWLDASLLTYLDMSFSGITDIDLNGYQNLRVLKLSENRLIDVNTWGKPVLKELDVSNNLIQGNYILDGSGFSSLRKLDISNNPRIVVPHHFTLSPSLISFRAAGVRFEDEYHFDHYWSGPNPAQNLRELDLSGTNLYKVESAAFRYLKELNLSNTVFAEPISWLDGIMLERLYLANTNLDNGFVSSSAILRELDISDNDNIDISTFNVNLETIEFLGLNNLSGSALADNLNHWLDMNQLNRSALRTLHLNGNSIASFEWLNGMDGLRSLHLRNNQIDSMDGLNDLPWLVDLDVYGNNIGEFSMLLGIEGLERLDFGNNPGGTQLLLQNVLSNNEGLTSLGVAGIDLQGFDFSSLYSGIRSLDISNTGVQDFTYNLNFLTTLNIAQNTLLGPLWLQGVRDLDISNTNLDDAQSLHDIGLVNLDISGNGSLSPEDISLIVDTNRNLTSVNVASIPAEHPSEFGMNVLEEGFLSQLNLSDTGILSLYDVWDFSDLNYLDLTGNPQLECADVAAVIRPGIRVIAPEHCVF